MTLSLLTLEDVAFAGLVLSINGLISLIFGLGLEASIAVAVLRMGVQLGAIGLLLKVMFEQASPLCTGLVAFVLVAVAGSELARRQEHRLRGWHGLLLCQLTLLVVVGIAMLFPLAGGLLPEAWPEPWYAPRYVLPVLALAGSSALASAGVALQALTHGAVVERAAIEARIAQGAHRFRAFQPLLRRALTAALAPLLQAMSASGSIALPGVMAGQLLAGADPLRAAKYQILLTAVLAVAGGVGAAIVAIGGVLLLSDGRHRLRLDRLHRAAPPARRPIGATDSATATSRRLGWRIPGLRLFSGART
jgi:putative ABC transport system permease protein